MSSIEIYELIFKKFNKILKKMEFKFVSSSCQDFPCGDSSGSSPSDSPQRSDKAKNKSGNKCFEIFEEFSRELDKQDLSDFEKKILKKAFLDYLARKALNRLSNKEKTELEKEIKESIIEGYNRIKQRGTIPAGFDNYIDHIFKRVRDWKTILKKEILETIKGDYTWNKVSDILQSLHVAGFTQVGNLPSLNDLYAVPDFRIGIDVSGSIEDSEYKKFMDEVYSIFKTVNVKDYELVLWEGEVTKTFLGKQGSVSRALEWLKGRKGYGGTNLRSFLEYCQKKKKQNCFSIILTDGYFEGDLSPKDFDIFKKTIFVLSRDCNFENVNKLKSRKIQVLKMN